jgi:hypothetical protein
LFDQRRQRDAAPGSLAARLFQKTLVETDRGSHMSKHTAVYVSMSHRLRRPGLTCRRSASRLYMMTAKPSKPFMTQKTKKVPDFKSEDAGRD